MSLAEKVNPQRLGYSPMMAAIVGALIGHDYGVRDSRGGKLTGLSLTSDGFVIADTTSHDTGAFIGKASDLERNLGKLVSDAHLTPSELTQFNKLKASHLTDWRVSNV
jgi:hypothetical protein